VVHGFDPAQTFETLGTARDNQALNMNDPLSPDAAAAAIARDFAAALAARWQAHPGEALLGVYLIGSLAHGGFSRRYSDIDMAVVTETGLTPADFDAMRADAAAISSELAAKLSIFWTDRAFSAGRFPPLDRADYLDHGVALVERERVTPVRPGLAEVRAYLTGKPFEAWSQGAAQFAALETLEPKSHKPYLRAHLYPARFVYSFMTGRMGSNDAAVDWLKDRAPPGLDVALIAQALDCRRAAADPDALFAARRALPRQVAACAMLINESEAERP
jgi:predicted nucleotidyltransferase